MLTKPHPKPKRDSLDCWSAPFGVWLGVPLRLHLTLVLPVAAASVVAVQRGSFEIALALAVYVMALVVHEVAHALAAWRIGGKTESIVMGPCGGLRQRRLPNDPEARVFVAMAGPMANLALVVAGVFCLAAQDEPALLGLLLPRLDVLSDHAIHVIDQPGMVLARTVVWINWPLFVLNLLPAFPFDGGEAARSLLWPWLGKRSSSEAVVRMAYITGTLLVLLSPVIDQSVETIPSIGLSFAMLGVVVCFGAHRDSIASRSATPDLDELLGVSDLGENGLLDDFWLDQNDQMVLVEMKQHTGGATPPKPHAPFDEPPDEERVDEVLAKLHQDGLDRLTPEERELLERASRSYRTRRSNE